MSKKVVIIYSLLTFALLVLTLPYVYKLFTILFLPKNISVLRQLQLYQWIGCGMALYFIIQRIAKKNLLWLETFSHELTHTIVALLLLRKIHSFNVEEGSGVVTTSGNNRYTLVPLALAPYCLPIFTYLLLIIRCLIAPSSYWIFDIFIGITIAFHFCCFKHQTGNHQPDINQYPLFFSYLYIATALIINTGIITVSFFPQYNVFTSIWRYLCAIYANVLWIF